MVQLWWVCYDNWGMAGNHFHKDLSFRTDSRAGHRRKEADWDRADQDIVGQTDTVGQEEGNKVAAAAHRSGTEGTGHCRSESEDRRSGTDSVEHWLGFDSRWN